MSGTELRDVPSGNVTEENASLDFQQVASQQDVLGGDVSYYYMAPMTATRMRVSTTDHAFQTAPPMQDNVQCCH